MEPYLSIVIPAYREAQRLPETMQALSGYGRAGEGVIEVLIVVERSPDGTLEIARKLAGQQAHSSMRIEVIDNGPQLGKGHAVRSGMLAAQAPIVLFMDADLSVPLAEIDTFLRYFEACPEVQVLVGNRQHPGSRITRSQTWLRRSMGQMFNRLLSVLALTEIRDTQCGFKAFRRETARAIFSRQRVNGFAFDVEVLMLAHQLGFVVRDLPVEWRNSPESRVSIVRDSLRMLWDALGIRLRGT
jgi:dolichyl-phosphate beta-glucosyltransferase